MKKMKTTAFATLLLILVLVLTVAGCSATSEIREIPAEDTYTYTNPEIVLAEPDAGIVIDGVLDEEAYASNDWLYLYNNAGGNNVSIAMTSHYGEKGIYFVFDVTESVPIYVNPKRSTVMNSCIEMYLAPSYVSSMQDNGVFEIDLLPTGEMMFKRGNGKIDGNNTGFSNVASTNDIMARLGTTTKGGEVNTESCYGYCMELFIPWDYLQWLEVDVDTLKDGFVYINPAHITSYNFTGTDLKLDRFWYHYAQQNGAKFSNVSRYFRFSADGVLGGVPVTHQQGEHYTISGATNLLPGLDGYVTIKPDNGYALTSVKINDTEQISNTSFNSDGSVTLKLSGTNESVNISAKAEAVSTGTKTLSGKVVLSNISKDTLEGLVLTYTGPQGVQPLKVDANGMFELKGLEQGAYVLTAEKAGYKPVTYSIFLNRDTYTELVLKYDYFQVTQGSCWILDEQNNGILYKKEGSGQLLGSVSYNDFTFWANLKYDPVLATQGTTDEHTQQRSGLQVMFSNGKYWHIDLLKQNGAYILQYAKISGNNSIFNWKVIHTLTDEQAAAYTGAEGIKLMIKRVGNKAAIYLGETVLLVEELDAEYSDLTAQLGFESFVANTNRLQIMFGIENSATLPTVAKPFFYSAATWDITSQHQGFIIKNGVAGKYTVLPGAIIANSITTTAVDLSPDTNDYSMIYILKFSNGEQFWVRLHHTDKDGQYRIQTMSGSTVFASWKSLYTLTEEETAKILGEGISFRVRVVGATAYIYLDGQEVSTCDLSTVVATGAPSGVEKATVTVSLRLDGNIGMDTKIPFQLVQDVEIVEPDPGDDPKPDVPGPVDPSKQVSITIGSLQNGTVTLADSKYYQGQTVTLTVTPDAGYSQKLYINGQPLLLDWKTNTYSFVATETTYTITGSFEKSLSTSYPGVSAQNRWDTANQAHGILNAYYPNNNDAWMMYLDCAYESFNIKVKNYMPHIDGVGVDAFAVVIGFKMSNGTEYSFRIIKENDKYFCQRFGIGGNDWAKKELELAAVQALLGEGANFKIERTTANTLTLSVNGTVYDTYTMAGVTAEHTVEKIVMGHYGNKGAKVALPFELGEAVVVESIFSVTQGSWDLSNQNSGSITIVNKVSDGSSVTTNANTYTEVSVKVKDYTPSKNEDGSLKQGNFSMQFAFIFDNGMQYQVRLHNTDADGNYKLQNMGGNNSLTGWKWQADLTAEQKENLLNGDGVTFRVKLVGATAQLYVDGQLMKTVELGAEYEGKTAQIQLCMNGNKNGQNIEIPFEVK